MADNSPPVTPTIPDIVKPITTFVAQTEDVGFTLRNQMVTTPATGVKAVFAVTYAPKNPDGTWMTGQDIVNRIEDDALSPHPVLANLASLLQLLQYKAKIDTTDPEVAALVGYIHATAGVDLTGLTLWDAGKAMDPILPALLAAQLASHSAPEPTPEPTPEVSPSK